MFVIILLNNMHHWKSNPKIWIVTETATNRHFVDINNIYKKLGVDIRKALAGFHALTGYDYNPSFFRKGKKTPFKILTKLEEY